MNIHKKEGMYIHNLIISYICVRVVLSVSMYMYLHINLYNQKILAEGTMLMPLAAIDVFTTYPIIFTLGVNPRDEISGWPTRVCVILVPRFRTLIKACLGDQFNVSIV